MNARALFLSLLLITVAKGQSTTAQAPSMDNLSPEKENAEVNTVNKSLNTDDLKSSGSTDRFTFTEADAKDPTKQQLQGNYDNNSKTAGDDNDDDEENEAFEAMALLLDNEKVFEDSGAIDANAKESGSSDDDDDDDDDDNESDVEEESDKSLTETKEPNLVPKFEEIQIRRQGNMNPKFGLGEINDKNSIQTEAEARDEFPYDTSNDGAPLLQLTQGGYQRPYQRQSKFIDRRQRMRTGSASQQSETLETPRESGINRYQSGQPPIAPQVAYANPYNPSLGFQGEPLFQHPFAAQGGLNVNGGRPFPTGFFNPPAAGFDDFSSSNFQSNIQPSDGRFISRDQIGIPFYQTPPNSELLFQGAPQFSQVQSDNQGSPSMPALFQPGSFPNYPSPDTVDNNTPQPNYSPLLRYPFMNPQFQTNPNFFDAQLNSGRPDFANPMMHLMANYPGNNAGLPLTPRLLRDGQITQQSSDQQVKKEKQDPNNSASGEEIKEINTMKVSQDKEDPVSVPFGTRILRQNNDPYPDIFSGQRDIYLRYPVREAGYATEENLPVQNTTENSRRNNEPSSRPTFPFFIAPREFRAFSNPDPYRNALNAHQQGVPNVGDKNNDDRNRTAVFPNDQFGRNLPFPFDPSLSRPPSRIPPAFPQRGQEAPPFQDRPFYPFSNTNEDRGAFDPLADVRGNNYQFPAPGPLDSVEDAFKSPTCAQGTNSSFCFEDKNYPRRELLYALNSDSLFMERLSSPNHIVEDIALADQNNLENPEDQDNYICKSDIKYAPPLRAKNVKGEWKVIVNIEKTDGNEKFIQSIRIEICKGINEPCNFTQVKTACVQKYTLQRLLSWSPRKGVHSDVYKVPISCACQIIDAKA